MKSQYHKGNIGMPVFLLTLLSCVFSQYGIAQVSVEKTPGITTDISGSIYMEVDGNWLSQGSILPGTSTLVLNGATNQTLRQDAGSFYNVTINKSGGEVTLGGDISCQGGSLSILNQDLVLNGFLVTFDPDALLAETPGNTVKGAIGYLTTTRSIAAPVGDNIAGLGIAISGSGDFGSTEIRRGHAAQASNNSEGILRYFDVLPQFNGGESSVLFLYDDSELNGNTETDLKLYRSPDYGTHWIRIDGVLNTSANSFEAIGLDVVSRFTLSSTCLETCIATQAMVQSTDVYLNGGGLGVLLPEEVNNGSRGACGIQSLTVFPEAFECGHVGMQEVVFTVTDNNGCSKTAEITVHVIDAIAPDVVCKDITIFLDEACEQVISPSDVNDGSYDACGMSLALDVTTFDCDDLGTNQVVLTATDPSGNSAQCIASVTVEMSFPEISCEDITIDIGDLLTVEIDPSALIAGDPDMYVGFVFSVDPMTLSCGVLGDHLVTLTATDPLGDVSTCVARVHLTGPDGDCDNVADQCDVCDGGDDQQDTDDDGVPDCADWDGYDNLLVEWRCGNNQNNPKVFLCHNGTVLCVSANAVIDHLSHGDFLGPCNASGCIEELMAEYAYPEGIEQLNEVPMSSDDLEAAWEGTSYHPGDIVLENCIPNPFNAETRIRFYLPADEQIQLSVFDVLGKPVLRLAQGMYGSGLHEVVFSGSGYAEGVYFYQLQTSDRSMTKSMVLSHE